MALRFIYYLDIAAKNKILPINIICLAANLKLFIRVSLFALATEAPTLAMDAASLKAQVLALTAAAIP